MRELQSGLECTQRTSSCGLLLLIEITSLELELELIELHKLLHICLRFGGLVQILQHFNAAGYVVGKPLKSSGVMQ